MQHSLHLKIDDSIFDKFMGLLEILPKGKVEVSEELDYPTISKEEARLKVQRAINNISSTSGTSIEEAFNKILKTK
ncbi:MAG: hypothetical protein COA44_14345 [Arcobacter sp.]|nr:MAG: hypothetical protein COA44_14345 [Arcobacter sp.]